MKVEIHNEEQGYRLYKEKSNWPERNFRNSFVSGTLFFEDDICNLIGEKKYNANFQNGQYIFEVSKSHLDLILGQRGAKNKIELLMYKD